MLKLGVLDQSAVVSGGNAVEAMRNTIELAKIVDRLGYSRYWVSEHHDTPALAGSSPEVLVSAIAAHTSKIRVGSGGVMLPHYSPYKVAENFRVLEALYPGRIDLGVGRAPGGMPIASNALRYGRPKVDNFEQQLLELAQYLSSTEDSPHSSPIAGPIVPTTPENWLLGSSDYGGVMAAKLGAGFSFAHFINGDGGHDVMRYYLEHFQPGPLGSTPQASVCVYVICADTEEEAERLASSVDLRLLSVLQGDFRRKFPSPEEALAYPYSEFERRAVEQNRRRMIVGSPTTVREQMIKFSDQYGVNELIVLTMVYDFQARIRSYELLAEIFPQI